MASGSATGFDFASDDILCSYEDYPNQENSNGAHSDSSKQELNKSQMARSSVFPSSPYSPPEDSGDQDVIISAVDRSMKKYADNLMRFLEGISSRLSQLELYCYNLDKSIGEMRSELARDHGDADAKLKFLEKHLQEVHRSVQILRDKQELADTQKELAKLQLAQKESSSGHSSQQNEERTSTLSDTKKYDDAEDLRGQQLALALPNQVAPHPAAPQPQLPPPQPITQSQLQPYYFPPQSSNVPGPTQFSQSQYSQPPNSQYQTPQPPQPQPQIQSVPQYQQQWTQQVQPPASIQPGARPMSSQVYPSYHPSQPASQPVSQPPNLSTPEGPPNSIPMQMPYSSQAMTYPYGGPNRQPQPPPQYAAVGPNQGPAYVLYDSETGRIQQSPFPPSGYSPNPQNPNPNPIRPPQQFVRNHPYNELIDKLMSMGYRGDHVASVIQRLEESRQAVDYNVVLDRLNGHTASGGQRGW